MERNSAASDKYPSVTEEDLAAVRKVIEETFAKVVNICDGENGQEVAADKIVKAVGQIAAPALGDGGDLTEETTLKDVPGAGEDVAITEDDGLAATMEDKIAVIEDACPSAEEAVAAAAAKFAAEVEDVVALAKGAIADLEQSGTPADEVSRAVNHAATTANEVAPPAVDAAPAAEMVVDACAEEQVKENKPLTTPVGKSAVDEKCKDVYGVSCEQASPADKPSEQAVLAPVEVREVREASGEKDAESNEAVPPADIARKDGFDAGKALAEVYKKVTKLCDEVDNTDDYKGLQSITSSKENISPTEEEEYEGHDEPFADDENGHGHEQVHKHEHSEPNPPSLPPRHDRSVSGGSSHAPRFMQPTTAWKGKGDGNHAKRTRNSRPAWVSASVSKRDSTLESTMRLKVSQINTGEQLHRSRSSTPPQDPSLPRYMQATAAVVGKYSSDSDIGSSGRRTPLSGRSHKVDHKDQRRATPVPFY